MPPLCLHVSIAREAAQLLGSPTLDQNFGGYAFGATLPDIHIIAKLSRTETHFFDLECEESASGTQAIFESHPCLARAKELDGTTRALVAGYLSHLITDEIWILDIYRPFFGRSSPLGENAMAQMYDKLVQYELDRREREARAEMESIRESILACQLGEDIALIGRGALLRWQDFVSSAVLREPNLNLFPYFARMFLLPRMELDPDELENFLESIDANLEWVIQYITPARLVAFRREAVSRSVALAREYLHEGG
ncbi:MAG: hypothetical protein SVP26_00625 [Chloroflexota bacterium]|nr:hypothetical protein [Chloroflexota bacterium]